MLFCNPNACFYEYLAYQNEWLKRYTQELGLNVIVFNYRGYGRSDMTTSSKFLQRWFRVMNPADIVKDAETVLEYATEKYIQAHDISFGSGSPSDRMRVKVMVHGQSLGGMAAAYVAMKQNKKHVDCLFIDRTFASLGAVAYWGAGLAMMTPAL